MYGYGQDTTIKSNGPLSQMATDLQTAREEFEILWKKHSHTHSREDRHAMNEAHKKALRLETAYRDGYKRLGISKLEGQV